MMMPADISPLDFRLYFAITFLMLRYASMLLFFHAIFAFD